MVSIARFYVTSCDKITAKRFKYFCKETFLRSFSKCFNLSLATFDLLWVDFNLN
mgnify:CR=1 FL=1